VAGLLWPIAGHPTTQGFAGTIKYEPIGYLKSDPGGPRFARKLQFATGVTFEHLHGAIDIGCPIGTPVVAPEAGRIVATSTYPATGEHFVMLAIRPGTILFFTHLSKFVAAKGDHVARGETIALSGNSGMSTGPHLHWEVRITGVADPDFRLSWRWYKWNPERLRVGGDLAGMAAISSPNADPVAPPAQPVAPPAAQPVEPDPVETAEPADAQQFDTVGDGASIAIAAERGIPLVDRSSLPQAF